MKVVSNKTLFKNQAASNIWLLLCSLLMSISKSSVGACFCLATAFTGFIYLFVFFLLGFKALSDGGEWKEGGGEDSKGGHEGRNRPYVIYKA